MPLNAAVQMYTVRDFTRTRTELLETLQKIQKIGYPAVQLSAVGAMSGAEPEVTARQARQMLDDHGLRCIATHRGWDSLRDKTDEEIAFHKELESDYTAIGGIPGSFSGEDGYRRFVAEAAPVVQRLKQAGIRFGYHNHAHEFQRIGPGQRTLFDIFIEEGGQDFTLEIDVYWAVHAGINPLRLFERCSGRVPVIHLKDKEVVPKEGPIMAAIGEGNLDWNAILPACQKAGVEWYAVEQDVCPRDPFDCLRSSFEFLSGFTL